MRQVLTFYHPFCIDINGSLYALKHIVSKEQQEFLLKSSPQIDTG